MCGHDELFCLFDTIPFVIPGLWFWFWFPLIIGAIMHIGISVSLRGFNSDLRYYFLHPGAMLWYTVIMFIYALGSANPSNVNEELFEGTIVAWPWAMLMGLGFMTFDALAFVIWVVGGLIDEYRRAAKKSQR